VPACDAGGGDGSGGPPQQQQHSQGVAPRHSFSAGRGSGAVEEGLLVRGAAGPVLRRSFGQFVTLLERCGRDGGVGVREIAFGSVQFGDHHGASQRWLDVDDADLARLFGEVLPNLPHLTKLRFTWCAVPIRHLSAFAAGLSASSSLLELHIGACFGGFLSFVPDLADLLRRNASVQHLTLIPRFAISRDACRQIFDSLRYDSNLRFLAVKILCVYEDDAMVLPTHPTSSLRGLLINVQQWTPEGKSFLARQLKANRGLEELHVLYDSSTAPASPRAWVEALESRNYTLYVLSEEPMSDRTFRTSAVTADERVAARLHRNERIRHMQALQQPQPPLLLQGGGGPVVPLSLPLSRPILWPRLYEMVSELPALVVPLFATGEHQRAGRPPGRAAAAARGAAAAAAADEAAAAGAAAGTATAPPAKQGCHQKPQKQKEEPHPGFFFVFFCISSSSAPAIAARRCSAGSTRRRRRRCPLLEGHTTESLSYRWVLSVVGRAARRLAQHKVGSYLCSKDSLQHSTNLHVPPGSQGSRW
jgi:hypothetical protein